jgi:diguanylate cyclase (GGDEF)-like protein/putative nucleotidyltransferase with HDIG domain
MMMRGKKLAEKNLRVKILDALLLLLCLLAIGFAVFQILKLSSQPHLSVIVPSMIFAFFTAGYLMYRLHNQILEQKVKEIRCVSEIHLATVEALATAIDARDQIGIGHIRRTQIYAVGIGEMMGLSKSEIQALKTGALLHDIGKLAVPDHILNKSGKLTPAEMEKMKIHASVGAAILEKIDFNYPVVETIRHHHESWDGSGYPDRLKGKEIPMTARILTVADVYDTLRGARPYRKAVSREEARRIIVNGAGTQFDPKVVDIFMRNLKTFEAQIEEEGLGYETDKQLINRNVNYDADNSAKSYVEQIKSANREVFTLYELAKTFSSSLELEEIYSLFAQKIRELVPFDTCVIYLFNEITDEAQAVYAEGENSSLFRKTSIKSGEGTVGLVLKQQQPVSSIIASSDFSFSHFKLEKNYSAIASLPLIADEKLLGAVSIYTHSLAHYEDEHLRLLETVSRIAANAILKSISHAETESRALTDPMTGLPNARSLQIHFEKEAARALRNGSRLQILMLDLDGFKPVNDTFGHKVGDKMLKELSKVMRGQLRDYDFLARYAGDEFAAIIPETDNRSIKELCQRLEKAVTNFVLPVGDGRFAKVGISIGTASYPQDGELLDQLLIAADKAMYKVKQNHKQAPNQTASSEQTPKLTSQPQRIPVKVIEPTIVNPEDVIVESSEENLLVELDESHIISSAIN